MEAVYAIIANHNYGEYVGQAIESALNQLHPTKVCIIDDGSVDNSVEVIGAALNISTDKEVNEKNGHYFIRQSPCLGASEARNKAMELVWDKADYFLILDSDDEAYPNKVQTMLRHFHPGVAAVYADYHIHNTTSGITVPEFKKPFDAFKLRQECIVHSQSLISKKALETVLDDGKVYDAELHKPRADIDGKPQHSGSVTEDYDLWLRLAEKYMIWHIPEFLSLVRVTGKNQSTPENITPEIFREAINRMALKARSRNERNE
jgi:glycosyltransferase involved in cell wall biosynthesis